MDLIFESPFFYFLEEHWLAINIISLLMLFGSLAITIITILGLPENYWVKTKSRRASLPESIVRNFIASIFFLMGLVMLVLPGQGVLTLVISIVIADIPFKVRLTRYFVKKHKVQEAMNYIRTKFGKKEFIWP